MRFKSLDRKKLTLLEKKAINWFISTHSRCYLQFAYYKSTSLKLGWSTTRKNTVVIIYDTGENRKPHLVEIVED